MKEKRPLNPAEAFRRSEKKKAKKNKLQARKDKVAKIPIDKRDPYQLIAQIQKYDILDHEGKLTGDGRTHKKRLVDQFNALRQARLNAGLEAIDLPKFDADAYEANKTKAKMGGGYNAVLQRMLDDVKRIRRSENAFDPETGLPNLPEGEPPFIDGVPGLPPYRNVEEAVQTSEEKIPVESGPKLMYEAAPVLKPVKKDKVDRKVDDFLNDLGEL